MKIKIDIALWDNTTTEDLEELGVAEKFVQKVYEDAVRKLVEAALDPRMEYELHIEVEDNTKQ